MRCYYHGDVEAVAICKSCGHAICHDCCVDVDKGAACRNRCEGDVAVLNELLMRSTTAYQKTSGAYSRNAVFMMVLGLVFGGLGGLALGDDGEPNLFLLVMGGVFVLWSISSFFTARRFKAK